MSTPPGQLQCPEHSKLGRSLVVVLILVVAVAGACTSTDDKTSAPTSPSASDDAESDATPGDRDAKPVDGKTVRGPRFRARLKRSHPCPEADGFTCSSLVVPLDHSKVKGKTLDLQVAAAEEKARRVLVVLTGGPGQAGVPFVSTIAEILAPALDKYRLVMLDQRGTGAGAIECPDLQEAVGGSDILVPPAEALRDCAAKIGAKRRFFTTADTVADLDLLRRALGVKKWTLDGISYGTYVAAHYAMSFPNHVHGLVLDSVVPYDGIDPFVRASLRGAARVLRDVCADGGCEGDPARDLAWIVRHGGNSVEILNALTIDSIVDPTFREVVDVPAALHAARLGDRSGLEEFVELGNRLSAFPAEELSAGLHAAALCADQEFPWGDASAPRAGRRKALRQALARIPARAAWPFDRSTAGGQGLIRSCLRWPPTPVPPPPERNRLPAVPILILQGERDLSTPLAWGRRVDEAAPRARFVVVPDGGHSVQSDLTGEGRLAVFGFLLKSR